MDGFIPTPSGRVPRVRSSPTFRDRLGDCRARLGLCRNTYTVNPGLYAVGTPTPDTPVVVTANYKLTFDTVRQALSGRDAWLLVVDTRGINVWCAGGKGSFCAEAVTLQVRKAGLDHVVSHRRLILPQLAANGVRPSGTFARPRASRPCWVRSGPRTCPASWITARTRPCGKSPFPSWNGLQ
ncbi:CO dehydrogenase/acetyl-CoA synthase delta subunit [Desulfonatronum thiosulfatophilum]|uniref:CO dehydrogenase/acetyl-CoA synthase delta subunit n=1 Tax=Desulfonatronum thiosulfatophilum TaxID=617002 RepID=A0A1G6BW22_9BACT|nr:CO dehydrogenase/acetyl-CoA synthase delta subunit [Desulfonatronum thiosulfatophilum]